MLIYTQEVLKVISDVMKKKRLERGLTLKQIADKIGVTEATVQRWESGNIKSLRQGRISQLAEILHTTPSVLMGWDDKEDNIVILEDIKYYEVPRFESIAAGFGMIADSNPIGSDLLPLKSASEAEETMTVVVRGDSMYPKIEDGDVIAVRKQSSVDSGTVAAILIDEQDAVVKKVTYGDDWILLHSFNPEYKDREFRGKDVQRIRVLGRVMKIIKEM